jgi:ATP/maltotriose-dependent transcriptional regulator MalT
MGELNVHREEPELAIESLSLSEELFVEMGGKGFLPKVYRLRAEAHCQAGETDLAESYCRRALDLAEELEMAQEQALILRVSGRLCMQCGELEKAREDIEQSIASLEEMNVPYELARSLFERASLERQEGQTKQGEADLRKAVSILEPLNARADLDRIRRLFEG